MQGRILVGGGRLKCADAKGFIVVSRRMMLGQRTERCRLRDSDAPKKRQGSRVNEAGGNIGRCLAQVDRKTGEELKRKKLEEG